MKERIGLDDKRDVYEIYQDFMSGQGKAYEKIARKQMGDEIGEKRKKDPAYLLEMSEDELRLWQRLDHQERMILIEGNMDIFHC